MVTLLLLPMFSNLILSQNSLHFKRVSQSQEIYSARVNLDYRVLGLLEDDHIYWFWIGSHAEYDEIIKRL
jgi:hypothetical protein